MSTTSPVAKPDSPRRKVTTLSFHQKKERGETISVLTAYDYPTAAALDRAGIDAILVGDSLAMVVLGYETTLPVTMDEMLHHCRAVSRGARAAMLIGDMPFMSYQVSTAEAVRNAGRFLQEGGMDAVKLEGGRERIEAIRAIVGAGIPVMGHLGLTPQAVNQLGGYRVQGRSPAAAERVRREARALQELGAFAVVLECVPAELAAELTEELAIPTIGIGAGPGTAGQVLVWSDLLGLDARFRPRFARRYRDGHREVLAALNEFAQDVRAARFPAREEVLA
jgi:3-methyl-2-oxobutanoate hydroxymethyltransferase